MDKISNINSVYKNEWFHQLWIQKRYGNDLKLKLNTKIIFLFKYLTLGIPIYYVLCNGNTYEIKMCKITIINCVYKNWNFVYELVLVLK